MTTVAMIKLYPDYPDGASDAERAALDAELQKSFSEQLESDWHCMDCGTLGLKYIMSCCDTVVESHDFSAGTGTGPAQVKADKPGGAWSAVGDLHETQRVLHDATAMGNPAWEVSSGGVSAEVHAVYRVGDVSSFP